MFPGVPGRKREGLSVPYKTESVLVCLLEVEVLYLLVSPYAATLLLGAIALLRSYIALLLDMAAYRLTFYFAEPPRTFLVPGCRRPRI